MSRYERRDYEVSYGDAHATPDRTETVESSGPLLAAEKVVRRFRGTELRLAVRRVDGGPARQYYFNGAVVRPEGRLG